MRMRKSTQGNWSLQKPKLSTLPRNPKLRVCSLFFAKLSKKVKSPQIKGGKEPGMKERLLKALFSCVSPEITQPTQTEISEKLTAGLSIVWPASRETWRANGCHKLYSRSVRQDVQDRCCLHMFGFINLQSEDAAWVWKASSKSQY